MADPTDSAHRRALALTAERASSHFVTTDEVLSEYLMFFSSALAPSRRQATAVVEDLLTSSVVRVIPQSRESFLSGPQLYGERPDKGYSSTDCISMQAMRRGGRTEALTNERILNRKAFAPYSADPPTNADVRRVKGEIEKARDMC